jgi:glycosyltransferase involved in cell wall biosynthesis
MRIIICVTNDIVTDQRVFRIVNSLLKLPSEILIAGIKRRKSLPLKTTGYQSVRFDMLFLKGPFFYIEFNIRLFFYLLFAKSDILVANDLDTLPAVYLASILKRQPIVYDSHEYFTELPELVDRKYIRRIWQWLERLMLPKIKFSYTVSNSIAAGYYARYGISMEVIRNLPLRIKALPDRRNPGSSNEKHIIYQGALNMGRGLDLAIKSMKYLDKCHLIIAGSGYIENELKDLVRSLDLSDQVQFLGTLRPEDLVKYTSQADLGISLEEGKGLNYIYALPNKLFDYIQAHIPVLISDLPEMAYIVRKYNVGMVIQTRDPLELSEVIKQMLYSNEMMVTWKQNLAVAAKELCWENEEKKLLDIYLRVIKDHASLAEGK